MTKINISPAWKDVKPKGYYVYLHRLGSSGEVFYVGKGFQSRGWHQSGRQRSSLWKNFCQSESGIIIEIVRSGLSEHESLLLEYETIKKYKDEGVHLVNQSSGGAGGYFFRRKTNVRTVCSNGMEFSSIANAARWANEEFNRNSSAGIIGISMRKGHTSFGLYWASDKHKLKEYIERKINMNKFHGKAVVCSNGMEFISCREACRWVQVNVNKNASRSAISKAAKGKASTAYGFTWWYKGNPAKEYTGHPKLTSKWKKVKCSNGMTFKSRELAGNWVYENGYSSSMKCNTSIGQVCNGKQKSAFGFTWEWILD